MHGAYQKTHDSKGRGQVRAVIASSLLVVAFFSPALAHHNTSAVFDMDNEITVEGTVERFDWKNPHVYVAVAVAGAHGEAETWRFEGRPLPFMRQRGWTPNTLRPGDRVTVTANPSRTSGRATGFLADITVEGRDIPAVRGPEVEARFTSLETANDGSTDSPAGIWLTVLNPDIYWIDDPTELSLTAAGRAAVEAFDELTMHPGLNCIPMSAPIMMVIPDTKSIELREDIGWIRGEFGGTERTIYFDGRQPSTPTVHGHSLARWEDRILVIETTNFSDHRMGNAFSLPSGNRKRLIEYLELTDEGTALNYRYELTDEEFLAAPITGEVRWVYRPSLDFVLTPCDVENARQFLED